MSDTPNYAIWKPEHDGHAPPNWREGMPWELSGNAPRKWSMGPSWEIGNRYSVPAEALNSPNDDAPKGFVKLDEFLLETYVGHLRQYPAEELAKHGITLEPPKDWATELWADLCGELYRADNEAVIELLRTRFEQMIAERNKRDD